MANVPIRPKNPYLHGGEGKSPFKIRWGVLVFWLIVILGGIYFFRYSSFFNISEIIVEGTKTIGDDEVLEIAEKHKEGNINLFKYPVEDLEGEISDKFYQVDSVNVSRGVPKTIKIEIIEREGFLIWQTQGKNYIIDKKGVVFREIDETLSYPVIFDNKNEVVELGEKILTSKFLSFTSTINKNFTKKTKLKIKKMVIEDTTFELNIETTNGWEIRLDTTRGANDQINSLAKLLPHIRKKVKEYIDLRTENWAYYK